MVPVRKRATDDIRLTVNFSRLNSKVKDVIFQVVVASGTYRVGENSRMCYNLATRPTKRTTGGSGEPASFEIVGDRRNSIRQPARLLRW